MYNPLLKSTESKIQYLMPVYRNKEGKKNQWLSKQKDLDLI